MPRCVSSERRGHLAPRPCGPTCASGVPQARTDLCGPVVRKVSTRSLRSACAESGQQSRVESPGSSEPGGPAHEDGGASCPLAVPKEVQPASWLLLAGGLGKARLPSARPAAPRALATEIRAPQREWRVSVDDPERHGLALNACISGSIHRRATRWGSAPARPQRTDRRPRTMAGPRGPASSRNRVASSGNRIALPTTRLGTFGTTRKNAAMVSYPGFAVPRR
jgi:hypothetical protein